MKAFKNNLRYALNLDETTRGEELLELIRKNNVENRNYEIIEKILSEYIENLSIGIQNLIEIFEPEVIGIGGSFVYFEDVLLPRLKCTIEKVNEGIIGRENIKIKTAILGNDAGMVGATL
jgi:predicted NBD/HSP70 family sugar kinase